MDRAARASKKRTRFLQGHLLDQEYQDGHAEELAERKAAKEQAKQNRKRQWKRKSRAESSKQAQERVLTLASSVSSDELIVCIRDWI